MKDHKKIVTHSGLFHADDVFAVSVLIMAHDSCIVERSRSAKEIESADFVVDVGGVYDPATGRYDHHQKGGVKRPLDEQGRVDYPYAAFGLVWKHHGRDAVKAVAAQNGLRDVSDEVVDKVVRTVDEGLVFAVDAADNGILLATKEVTTISHVIASFNKTMWVKEDDDECFEAAVSFACNYLRTQILRELEGLVVYPRRLQEAEWHADGQIAVFDEYYRVSALREPPEGLLYILFPGTSGGWMVQQIPESPGSPKGRLPLPEEWAGLRAEELAVKIGIQAKNDLPFCHNNRFIGGAVSKADALVMAKKAIKLAKKS